MYRVRVFLVSESAVTDAQSNNLSIFNIIEGLAAPAFPILIQKLTIVALIDKAAEDAQTPKTSLEIKLNGVTEFTEQQVAINFQGSVRTRAVIQLNGFVVRTPGQLTFHIDIEGVTAQYEISIQKVGTPTVDLTPNPKE